MTGLTQRIAVIPGDGIGKEVTAEAIRCLDAVIRRFQLPLEYEVYPDVSAEGYIKYGTALPDHLFQEISAMDAIFLGAVGDPRLDETDYARSVVLRLRFELDLYVNLRPAKLYDPAFTPLERKDPIDIVIIRENTEDIYTGIGGVFKKDTPDEIAVHEAVYTRKGTERILRYAFEHARQTGRSRVTLVDKSNVLVAGHGLWVRLFRDIARQYPGIQTDHLYVDNAAMQIVKRPWELQVIVTTNMFGDILSDLVSEVVGGLGIAPSGNLNPETHKAMFEPVHGSAPKYAGKGIANPLAAVLAMKMLLEFLGYSDAAVAIEGSVRSAVGKRVLTRDLGGSFTTSQVGNFLVQELLTSSLAAAP
ncbi:MAG: 3-isopropylmalate dehydrogenase [bacterium JZ-2024 1]